MSNYPPGVTDSHPYFTDESEYEDEQAEGDQPLKTCVTCGKPFRYPPSDNKDNEDRCAWCIGKSAPPESTRAAGEPILKTGDDEADAIIDAHYRLSKKYGHLTIPEIWQRLEQLEFASTSDSARRAAEEISSTFGLYDKGCPDCEGEGSTTRSSPCPTCDGYGSLLTPAGRELLEFLKRRGVRVSSTSDEQEQRSR